MLSMKASRLDKLIMATFPSFGAAKRSTLQKIEDARASAIKHGLRGLLSGQLLESATRDKYVGTHRRVSSYEKRKGRAPSTSETSRSRL